jgi:hypothetical protein
MLHCVELIAEGRCCRHDTLLTSVDVGQVVVGNGSRRSAAGAHGWADTAADSSEDGRKCGSCAHEGRQHVRLEDVKVEHPLAIVVECPAGGACLAKKVADPEAGSKNGLEELVVRVKGLDRCARGAATKSVLKRGGGSWRGNIVQEALAAHSLPGVCTIVDSRIRDAGTAGSSACVAITSRGTAKEPSDASLDAARRKVVKTPMVGLKGNAVIDFSFILRKVLMVGATLCGSAPQMFVVGVDAYDSSRALARSSCHVGGGHVRWGRRIKRIGFVRCVWVVLIARCIWCNSGRLKVTLAASVAAVGFVTAVVFTLRSDLGAIGRISRR